MPATYVFGPIPGNPPGTEYDNRAAAMAAGVHQVSTQGISGNAIVGANSIVVSGGYEDDVDDGTEIIYTGAGGQQAGRQAADQTFDLYFNAALVVSEENGLPVRVLRGANKDSDHAPARGYRYDGLYRVESHWYEQGKSGFKMCRYRLLALDDDELSTQTAAAKTGTPAGQSNAPGAPPKGPPEGNSKPGREPGITIRVVRDSTVSAWVKKHQDWACQICGVVLDLPVGNYAEGAHIRALGKPHEGPDTVDNLLCLCPTHHLLLDKGALYITDDLQVHDYQDKPMGPLRTKPGHDIDLAHVGYHRRSTGK